MKKSILSNNNEQTQMVMNVGKKIQNSVERYYEENNMLHELKNYDWVFNLIVSKEMYAGTMTGSKVAVYERILSIVKDEKGLGGFGS